MLKLKNQDDSIKQGSQKNQHFIYKRKPDTLKVGYC